MRQISAQKSGYSLVELLVVIAVLGILMTVAVLAIQGTIYQSQLDRRVSSDLQAISNALIQYRKDNGKFPTPLVGAAHNVLCFKTDASYNHDCDTAVFRQAQIDNGLLEKRYLPEVPVDPRTRGRYVYGVTKDGQYFQVAGVLNSGDPEARTVGNLGKGFYLPSLIRSYNSAEFVVNRGTVLPYNPESRFVATARNVVLPVTVGGEDLLDGAVLEEDAVINAAGGGQADLYFADGSVTHLDPGAKITLVQMDLVENDANTITTKILIKLHAGNIWNKVVRLASKSEFQVESTGAVAGVRGTEFGVGNDGTTTKLYVWSGEVGVAPYSPEGIAINDAINDMATFDNALRGTPENPSVGTYSSTLSDIVPITNTDDIQYMQNKAKPSLSGSLMPYVREIIAHPATEGSSAVLYDLYVIFAGMDESSANAPYDVDGFEIYPTDIGGPETKLDTLNREPLRLLKSQSQFQWNNDKKAYVLSIDYSNSIFNSNKAVLIRGYQYLQANPLDELSAPKIFSELSWPPLVLSKNAPLAETSFNLTDEYVELDSVPEVTPSNSITALQVVIGGHSLTSPSLTYFPKGDPVVLRATTSGDIKEMTWSGCTPVTNSADCSFNPTVGGVHTVAVTINDGEDTENLSLYTPEWVSSSTGTNAIKYIYSAVGANSATWDAAKLACYLLTEGGVSSGTWKLPAKEIIATNEERAIWCNSATPYDQTVCPNMPGGGVAKIYWSDNDPSATDATKAYAATSILDNDPGAYYKEPTSSGLANYGYRCVIQSN